MARRAGRGTALLVALVLGPVSGQQPTTIEEADRLWSERARGFEGEHADAEAAQRAVTAYEGVLARRPESLEAIWKLQRALHFLGEYGSVEQERRRRLWERGRDLGRRSMEILHGGDVKNRSPHALAREVEHETAGAGVHFWAGVFWGLWGESKGAFAAVRKGVAGRIRDHAGTAIELDPGFAEAGPYRLLGRLHADAPKVPFITGWVSREKAVRLLERAVELAPDDPANGLYLAQALLEHRPARRAEALDWLRRLAAREPRPESLVEDTAILEEARALLAKQEPAGG